ncbi:ER-PM contact site phospholipid-binding protein Hob2 [Schizosaccharomyces osmophilus]|uniref:ER-PM contact site phospholipid-binding protein Hob2 n=1 Tax=Schizosaccharomyces osmophilus TaxID=2545709 RepID=A0AAF0AST4_9SCHI|nr:ER-PM contact site phospholipid-binding protein Hob2 [Schizosaccharomyces osmophilus]WBW71131.1 ER-PM contact site phospholipid-binding protein Hob2 [Schizosaccharomyces osmophilus]
MSFFQNTVNLLRTYLPSRSSSTSWLFTVIVLLFHVFFWVLAYYFKWPFTSFGFFSIYGLRHTFADGQSVFISYIGIRFHRPSSSNPHFLSLVLKGVTYTLVPGNNDRKIANESSSPVASGGDFESTKVLSSILGQLEQKWLRLLNARWIKWIHISLQESQVNIPFVGTLDVGNISTEVLPSRNTMGIENNMKKDAKGSRFNFSLRILNLLYIDLEKKNLQITDFLDINITSQYSTNDPVNTISLDKLRCSVKIGVFCIDLDSPLFNFLKEGQSLSSAPKEGSSMLVKDSFEAFIVKLTEVQIQIGTFKLWKRNMTGLGATYVFNGSDLGFTLNLLNVKSPSHRMFFSADTIVHQILASILSFSIENYTPGHPPHYLLNIPLVTITCLTSSLGQFAIDPNTPEKLQKSSLRINSTLTSPSLDIRLELLHDIMSLFQKKKTDTSAERSEMPYQYFPETKVSMSLYEPVVRFLISSESGSNFPGMIVANLSSMFLEFKYLFSLEHVFAINSSLRLASNHVLYHSPQNRKWLINSSEMITLSFNYFYNNNFGDLDLFLNEFRIRIEEEEVVKSLKKFLFLWRSQSLEPQKDVDEPTHGSNNSVPFLFRFPGWLKSLRIRGKSVFFIVKAIRREISDDPRGINCHIDQFDGSFEPGNPLGTRQFNIGIGMFQVKSMIYKDEKTTFEHILLKVPKSNFTYSTLFNDQSNSSRLTMEIGILRGFLSLLHNCCLLYAYQATRSIFSDDNTENTEERRPVDRKKSNINGFTFELRITNTRLKFDLDDNINLLLDVGRLTILKRDDMILPELFAKFMQIHTRNPDVPELWDKLFALGDFRYCITEFENPRKLHLVICDYISLRIPHKFVPFLVIESAINTVKAALRVSNKPITIDEQHELAQQQKKPRVVPRLNVKSTNFKFELDDDPFETRLSMIYRIGLTEQKMRVDRWNAFEERLRLLRSAKSSDSTSGSSDDTTRLFGSNNTTDGPNEEVMKKRLYDLGKTFQDILGNEDTDSTSFLEKANVSEEEACQMLKEYDSLSWISNIRRIREFRYNRLHVRRMIDWPEEDSLERSIHFDEKLIPVPIRPPLADIALNGFDFYMDRPTFPLEDLPKFMNNVGSGQPLDYGYSIYFPMFIDWKMSKAKFRIRDYPLPMVYVPKLGQKQNKNLASWHFRSNFVITEQQASLEAIRDVTVPVISGKESYSGLPYAVNVTRTVSPIKTFSDTQIDINTSLPVFVLWAASYQPAMTDITRIIDSFTKIPIDPSDRLGFWDKLRLVAHSQLRFRWKENGDIFLSIKGSRDPYMILGPGAGFQFCWSGNVKWDIACDENSANFIVVDSDEFYLTIPDFPRQINGILEGQPLPPRQSQHSHKPQIALKDMRCRKIIAKLVGKVRWRAGFVPERHCEPDCEVCDGKMKCRLWNFKPHWEIKTMIPKYCHDSKYGTYDAYRRFRSHYLHCSLAVESPRYLDPEKAFEDVRTYNTIHLTPLVFSHFSLWWHLFSNNMSYPLRRKPLFPSFDSGSSKRFGRHLATFKYSLELSPLLISHMYNYKTTKNWQDKTASATGLKAKVEHFSVDLHQRSEKHEIRNKTFEKTQETTSMRVHLAEIDFKTIDLRAITASFDEGALETSKSIPVNALDGPDKESFSFRTVEGPSAWVDIDDFHEADWLLPQRNEKCAIYPLAFSPRFTYYRHTKPHMKNEKDEKKIVADTCRFGDEKTHRCMMPGRKNPRTVQYELLKKRREELYEFMNSENERLQTLEELIRTQSSANLKEEFQSLKKRVLTLNDHYRLLGFLLENTKNFPNPSHNLSGQVDLSYATLSESVHAFNNRFVAHNVQIKWNNFVRNAVLSYVHEMERVRGFAYYMSQKAIRFLQDLQKTPELSGEDFLGNCSDNNEEKENARNLLKFLLEDAKKKFVVKTDNLAGKSYPYDSKIQGGSKKHYDIIQSYVFRFIAPQIQLQCNMNPQKAVIISIQSLQIKILSIVDPTFPVNDINYLVERRFLCNVNESQFFTADANDFRVSDSATLVLNKYGCENNSVWPPWVPLETTFDFVLTPAAFSRFLHRVSFSAVYTKHNDLRLKETVRSRRKYFEDLDVHTDTLTFDVPRVVISTDSSQYYDLFTIITNLLLYQEPSQKQRSQRLEEIMLAADFSDLTGTPEMVAMLQNRVHHLEEVKLQHQLYDVTFNVHAHIAQQLFLQNELHRCGEELFYLIESIASVQSRGVNQNKTRSNLSWFIMAKEVVWHLLEDNKRPFLDVSLQNATFRRIENTDSSNLNTLEIESMKGSNLAPGCQFENIICPYFNTEFTNEQLLQQKFIRVHWELMEAVAGIQVVQHFEINLFPLSLQIEHELASKLFDFAFPGNENKGNLFGMYSNRAEHSETTNKEVAEHTPGHLSENDNAEKNNSSQELGLEKYLDLDGRSELHEMLNRAGNNMLVAYFKIPSVVLRLSYRGMSSLGLENINGFVLSVPTLEYRNEVCSYLDLAVWIKHDLIRAVLSHSGKLLVDKVKGGHNVKAHEREMSAELLNLQQLSAEHHHPVNLESLAMNAQLASLQEPTILDNLEENRSLASAASRKLDSTRSSGSQNRFWEYHGSRSKKLAGIIKRHIPHSKKSKKSRGKSASSNDKSSVFGDGESADEEQYETVKRELILGNHDNV